MIILGFAAIILMGAVLLMLPFSSAAGNTTPFTDALFTSTSAVCVTGLVVHDTAAYWSVFGQSVILVLIQIGGMGVVTVAASMIVISGRKISLLQRTAMQEAVAAPKIKGIVRMNLFIIKMIFVTELAGALLMFPVFCRDFGPAKGVWMAVFHSVSAFCNAGFDLMGTQSRFSSLTNYAYNPVINIVIMALIVAGGLGFVTWEDVRRNRLRFYRYSLQSKVILTITAVLILLPAAYLYFFEFGSAGSGDRVWLSLFQSVTTRTAGFNTADLTSVSGAGIVLIIALMLTGGSPGSTAGGMKTTNIAVLFSTAVTVFRRGEDVNFFGRRLSDQVIRNAVTLLLMYLVLFLCGGMIISRVEGLGLMECLFETASAIGTVGLSLGITGDLGSISRMILIFLMFFGRVGGITVIYAAVSRPQRNVKKLPLGDITVG